MSNLQFNPGSSDAAGQPGGNLSSMVLSLFGLRFLFIGLPAEVGEANWLAAIMNKALGPGQ